MVKKELSSHVPYVAVVGLVAVVAIVILVLNMNRSADSADSVGIVDEEGNLVGEASRLGPNVVINRDKIRSVNASRCPVSPACPVSICPPAPACPASICPAAICPPAPACPVCPVSPYSSRPIDIKLYESNFNRTGFRTNMSNSNTTDGVIRIGIVVPYPTEPEHDFFIQFDNFVPETGRAPSENVRFTIRNDDFRPAWPLILPLGGNSSINFEGNMINLHVVRHDETRGYITIRLTNR